VNDAEAGKALRGSCLCGDVAFEAAGPLRLMSHCHCSMCRKSHGAAFGTFVGASAAGFRVVRGDALVAFFESSPGNRRGFCPRCGSTLWNASAGDHVFMPAGCLDDDPGVRPLAHIFVGSMAPWDAIHDALPRIDAYPPGMGTAIPRPAPPPAPAGHVRGSCLCGAIAYEIAGPPLAMRHCHCSRCRKARSAAHATNVFWRAGALRWVRGEDLVRRYKVEGARFFTNTFCGVCGSKVPRVDFDRDLAVAPAGGLDHDPGLRPQMHIFVGSKAPWFDIHDSLPRHEGAAPTPPGA
jgi:hypothetical protein